MTQVFKRNVAGPATHAFLLGVGAYPDAKPGRGVRRDLRTVQDLPSAADSAKFMHDWLIENQDKLAAKLGSVEMLIADPVSRGGEKRYAWKNPKPVGVPDSASVKKAGKDWLAELKAKPGDIAFFYACGHGAGLATRPVIFLSDLNTDDTNPWAHHDIGFTATSLRYLDSVGAGFFFSDTCREFIPKFQLERVQDTSRFAPDWDAYDVGRDKVALLSAASEALLAYEGALPSDDGKIGRFTQTLLKALDGASARWDGGRWVVYPSGLGDDMKVLQRSWRPEWRDKAFEPSFGLIQNEVIPIIEHDAPQLPVLVYTEPEDALSRFDLRICRTADRAPPWIRDRGARDTKPWLTFVEAGLNPLWAVAEDAPLAHQSAFVPNAPNFKQRIPTG